VFASVEQRFGRIPLEIVGGIMREDMPKVIVERARRGDCRARKGRARSLDELPSKEGMRRRYAVSGDWKELNENLAPLRRYLERQVGRPWNKVYSEISLRLRVGSDLEIADGLG